MCLTDRWGGGGWRKPVRVPSRKSWEAKPGWWSPHTATMQGARPLLPSASPGDLLWAGPEQHRGETGADKARVPSRPEKQIKSSGSCSLWHKMVSGCHCQRIEFSYSFPRQIAFTVLPFSKGEAGTEVMQKLHGFYTDILKIQPCKRMLLKGGV